MTDSQGKSFRCPCCRHKTLSTEAGYEICPICYWEDDGQGDARADEVWGGANGELSLSQARTNYKVYGASDLAYKDSVRGPLLDEIWHAG